MPHILIAGHLHSSGLALLDAAVGVRYEYVPDADPNAYLAYLPTAEGLILRTQPLTAQDIAQAPALKIVSRHGVGFEAVDVTALSARSIPLTIVGDVNSHTVAEHAMMLLLATSRALVMSHNALCQGNWQQRNGFATREVRDKTLLIVGYGRIGRRMAALARGFGLRIVVYDPFLNPDDCRDVECVANLHAALPLCDFLSLHVPQVNDGVLIAADELALMKSDAIIINTARGGLIDETALVCALESGQIGGAGLDVFTAEPCPPNHPFLHLDNVIVTPHSAALTKECATRMATISVQNVLDYFQGTLDHSLIVNSQQIGYRQ